MIALGRPVQASFGGYIYGVHVDRRQMSSGSQ